MCGDIMITKNKKQNWSNALVVSIMCAVLLTLIRQSINNQENTYASISSASTKTQWVQIDDAVSQSPDAQWSRNVLDDITNMIVEQKKSIDEYLLWLQDAAQVDDIVSVSAQPWAIPSIQTQDPTLTLASEYQTFENLKKLLSDKYCEYRLPIDNTDLSVASDIQWWLDRCLLTVSAAQKVYPNDVLTHEMMRVIAQRAWFIVKMEYASNKPVSKEQLFTFFYALQQNHKIGDLPVIVLSAPVKRSEYMRFLHKLFGDVKRPIRASANTWESAFVTQSPSKPNEQSITVKAFKEILIAQGQKMDIMPYDDAIILTPEIMKTLVSWSTDLSSVSKTQEAIGIDKEMMKQTLSRLIEKI